MKKITILVLSLYLISPFFVPYVSKIVKADNAIIQWTNGGVAISTGTGNQNEESIIYDGQGGMIAAWEDNRGANQDIYAQKIDSTGAAIWTANGLGVAVVTGAQGSPALTSDGSGGAIIAWEDT